MYIEDGNLPTGGTAGLMIYATLAYGSTDAWSPTGYTAAVDGIVITTDVSGSSLDGLTGGATDRRVTLFNAGPGLLTIANAASGTAGDGFINPTLADLQVAVGGGVGFAYDLTNAVWRAILPAAPGGGGGGAFIGFSVTGGD